MITRIDLHLQSRSKILFVLIDILGFLIGKLDSSVFLSSIFDHLAFITKFVWGQNNEMCLEHSTLKVKFDCCGLGKKR